MPIRAVVLGALLLAACGSDGGHAIDTSTYSKACVSDTDCVAVYQGKLSCCGGDCPNAAIAAADYDAYSAALQADTPMCSPAPPCAQLPAGACGDRTPLCVGNLCTLATASASSIVSAPGRAAF